jgi:hypothetical protein
MPQDKGLRTHLEEVKKVKLENEAEKIMKMSSMLKQGIYKPEEMKVTNTPKVIYERGKFPKLPEFNEKNP